MQTLSIGPPPAESAVDVHRQDSVVAFFAGTVMMLAVTVAFGYAVGHTATLPLLMKLIAVPMMGFGMLLTLGITGAMFQVARSSTKPTNWLLAISQDAVYLNLRSARNASIEDGLTRAVCFDVEDVLSVGKVREAYLERNHKGFRTTGTDYIELEVQGCEPGELEALIESERMLDVATPRKVSVETRGRHHHVPVFMVEPNRVRMAWNARLFKALGERFRVAEARNVDLTELLASMESEERVRALMLRGQRFKAVRLAHEELGLGHREAREWVDGPVSEAPVDAQVEAPEIRAAA